MKSKLLQILILVSLIAFYHCNIHNPLEKRFSQMHFDYHLIKRPLAKCVNREKSVRLGCIGMPSGHTETVAVFSTLLYLYNIIPLWVCLLCIVAMGIHRVTTNMHTMNQVIMGSLLGLLYAVIYKKVKYGFVYVFFISVTLFALSKQYLSAK